MKLVKSLAILAAVIVLGIIVYIKVYKVEQQKKSQQAQEGKLIRFNLDSIKEFTLVRPDSSITFERGIGRIWNILKPLKTEASGERIYGLFSQLDQSNIITVVDEKPKDLSPYGIKNTKFYMSMTYDTGKPDTLFIGTDTPDKTMAYVKFSSEKRILAISNALTDLMKKSVTYYRARTILNILVNDIQSFEITRGKTDENRIQMVHNGVTWMMTAPWNNFGDITNMDELLKGIADANKLTLEPSQPGDLEKYGLNNPSFMLNVHLKYGMPDKILLIGNKLKEKGRMPSWYAKQFDNEQVFTLENRIVTLLSHDAVWYIDKQPVKFDREVVNKIVLKSGKEPITFAKDPEGNWNVVSPVDKNVPREVINSIFAISRFMLINGVYSMNPVPADLAKTGLDKPKFILTFFSDGQLLAEMSYGKTFTQDAAKTYVQSNQSPTIFTTASEINASLNYVLETVFGK
ncbi:MAG: DUF4340 domain-containing protein [Candidatus Latescibacterota bacterium]